MDLDLSNDRVIDALKTTDVVEQMKKEKTTPKPYTYSLDLTQAQVERLSRLSATGDWQEAINETIMSLVNEGIGRAIISAPSLFGNAKVTGPSQAARWR